MGRPAAYPAGIRADGRVAEYPVCRRLPVRILFRRGESIHPIWRAAPLGYATRSECLRRPTGGGAGDMRGRVLGTGASLQRTDALVFQGYVGDGNFVHLLALRMDRPRAGSSASVRT